MIESISTNVLSNFIYDVIKKTVIDSTQNDKINKLLERTKIIMNYKNNYLDYLMGLIDEKDFFFNVEIKNQTQYVQNFKIKIHYEKINGAICSPFVKNSIGLNLEYSYLGNLYYLESNSTQIIKLAENKIIKQLNESNDTILSSSKDNELLNFGLTDFEYKCEFSNNNKKQTITSFLSQFQPVKPEHSPFIGTGFGICIEFIISDGSVSRFVYGGFACKDNIEKLENFIKNNCGDLDFTFFHLANLVSTKVVILENKTTNEKYIVLDNTYVSGLHLNTELFNKLHNRANYLYIFNRSSTGCITPITVFHANNTSSKVNFPPDFF